MRRVCGMLALAGTVLCFSASSGGQSPEKLRTLYTSDLKYPVIDPGLDPIGDFWFVGTDEANLVAFAGGGITWFTGGPAASVAAQSESTSAH